MLTNAVTVQYHVLYKMPAEVYLFIFCLFYSAFNTSELSLHRPPVAVRLTMEHNAASGQHKTREQWFTELSSPLTVVGDLLQYLLGKWNE